jgi:lysophospholipase L1-like esterase
MRILCFGDSITQGFWDIEGGWVARIRRHFDEAAIRAMGQGTSAPFIEMCNLGLSGDTTRNLLNRMVPEIKVRAEPGDPLVVLLAIGTNDDLFENTTQWVQPDEFRVNLINLVDSVMPLCSRLILIGNPACDESKTTPVSWGNYCYWNRELERSEGVIQAVAELKRLPFVPLYKEFGSRLAAGELLLADGLHPNSAGHELIASQVLPVLCSQ